MRRNPFNIREQVAALLSDETAGTMTLTAVLLPVLLGFSGVGLDMTGWYMHKRAVQNLSDMAALEAVHSDEWFDGEELEGEISSFLNARGFDTDSDDVTVNSPPTSGNYVGEAGYTEIIVSRDVPMNFVNAFYGVVGGELDVTVSGRAVAGKLIVGTQCIVALDETADRALNFSGNIEVGSECGVATNSVSSEAVYIGGSAELSTPSLQAVGDINVSGGGALISDSPAQSLSQPAPNPYEDLDIPPISSCDYTGNTTVGDDVVLTPGRYCGNVRLQGNNITFDPGVYIIDGGDFLVNASASAFGEDVVFILTGDTAGDVGGIHINGGSFLDLSGRESGEYQGFLFVQDPKAEYRSNGSDAVFNGGADMMMDGILYFPSGDVSFQGGASAVPSCLQIYGATVDFLGSSTIGNDDATCEALGMDVSPQVRIMLVE